MNNEKNQITLLIVFVFLIIFAIGGYFIGNKFPLKNKTVSAGNEQSAELPATKTYTSKNLGFSFEYPSGYFLTEESNAVGLSASQSDMWDYNISADSTQFKTIKDWLATQPKGGVSSEGVQPLLWIGDDSLLVDNYVVVDYNGNKKIYGKNLMSVTVRDGKFYKISIRGQMSPLNISLITPEALAIIASFK